MLTPNLWSIVLKYCDYDELINIKNSGIQLNTDINPFIEAKKLTFTTISYSRSHLNIYNDDVESAELIFEATEQPVIRDLIRQIEKDTENIYVLRNSLFGLNEIKIIIIRQSDKIVGSATLNFFENGVIYDFYETRFHLPTIKLMVIYEFNDSFDNFRKYPYMTRLLFEFIYNEFKQVFFMPPEDSEELVWFYALSVNCLPIASDISDCDWWNNGTMIYPNLLFDLHKESKIILSENYAQCDCQTNSGRFSREEHDLCYACYKDTYDTILIETHSDLIEQHKDKILKLYPMKQLS